MRKRRQKQAYKQLATSEMFSEESDTITVRPKGGPSLPGQLTNTEDGFYCATNTAPLRKVGPGPIMPE